jgi:hypothetical protein
VKGGSTGSEPFASYASFEIEAGEEYVLRGIDLSLLDLLLDLIIDLFVTM